MTVYWQIQPEWPGATVFIVGGGPSLCNVDLSILKNQRVIAINSSYQAVPFADFLLFSDFNWWDHHQTRVNSFHGRLVCASRSPSDPRLLMVRRKVPPGLDQPNDCLPIQFTTATGAMGLAIKLGARKLILLGIDGKPDVNGKMYHHKPHPWAIPPQWQERHRADLQKMVRPLEERGIGVALATPSAYEDLWPLVELKAILNEINNDHEHVGNGGQHLHQTVHQEVSGELERIFGHPMA
jgi:hypothetical protein